MRPKDNQRPTVGHGFVSPGGKSEFDLEADDIKQLLTRLGELCPELKPRLDKGVAPAVDGRGTADASVFPDITPTTATGMDRP